MQTILNRQRWNSCPYDQLSLSQLSDTALLAKQTKNQRMGGVLIILVVFMLVMAYVLEAYLVAVTTWAMIPALDEYAKKRKAINRERRNRKLI